jgi:hypothetical protein
VFVGEAANDVAGTALASTDGDGDGRPEPVIAACNNDLAGTNAGTVYLGPAIPSGLLSLGASPAKLSGASAYDQAGWSVAGGFDANGDGREDLLVGAPYANPSSRSDAGEVFLVLAPFSGTMSLTDARARLQGGTSYDYAGWSVAAAGDPDGDGAPDLLVGAIGQDTGASMAGAVYLLPASLSGTVALSSATARLWGESAYDGAGVSLCGLGDQDGDGLDDLLVGAWQGASYGSSSGSGRGVVYVLNGPVDGAFSLALAEARILGRVDLDYAGFSVACPGDLDGDGRADLLLGAYGAATGALDGGLAALFVGPFEGSMDLGAAQVRAYATANEDDAGYSVSGSGDFDGDGIPDLLVGAIREDSAATNAGAAYVLFGQELVSSW